MRLMVSTLALLCLACAAGGKQAEVEAEKDPVVDIETTTVTSREMPDRLRLTGEVTAAMEALVAADVNGTVTAILAERGQQVKKGDTLVTVDTRTASLAAEAGKAQMLAAQTQAKAAKDDCDRAEVLFKEGAIPEAQYTRTIALCRAQQQAFEAASASAGISAATLSKTRVKAPFDGVVGDRYVDVGEFVSSPQPVFSLTTQGALRVRFAVPESASASVGVGQEVRFKVATGQGELPAIVRYVSPALRPMLRDRVVEAEVQGDLPGLLPGMFAEVDLLLTAVPRLVVPASAVVTEGTLNSVYRVKEGRAFLTAVRVGEQNDGQVAILSDVAENEVVVDHPPAGLPDGSRVE